MKEISFGPVLNEDGTPTEFTKQMLQGTGRELTPPFNFIDETEIRRKRHLAAFLGDCGIQTCDVCHTRNQGQEDDPSQHDIPREPPAHKAGKHCVHSNGKCCWCEPEI